MGLIISALRSSAPNNIYRAVIPDALFSVDAKLPGLGVLTLRSGVRASVDEIENSGSGWTFAKLTIANSVIREIASSAS